MTANKLFPASTPFGLLDGYSGAIARADHGSTGSPHGDRATPTEFRQWVLLTRIKYTGSGGVRRVGFRIFSAERFFCLFSDR
jgi:hypothetical protein